MAKSLKKITKLTREFVKLVRTEGVKKISITMPPHNENLFRDQRLEFALIESGFILAGRKPTALVRTDSKNPEMDYSSQCRRLLRKSYKNNLSFSKNSEIVEFYRIIEKNLMKFDTTPTHSLAELVYLNEQYPDSIELCTAIYENKIAAGVLTFKTSTNSKLAFYINQDYDYSRLGAMTYCLHKVIMDCLDNGIDFLDLGVSMDLKEDSQENLAWSLLNFKESFGSVYYSRNTYTWGIQ